MRRSRRGRMPKRTGDPWEDFLRYRKTLWPNLRRLRALNDTQRIAEHLVAKSGSDPELIRIAVDAAIEASGLNPGTPAQARAVARMITADIRAKLARQS